MKRLFIGGGRWLSLHRSLINRLNVFPVPDGDTGTNMTFTVRGALQPLLLKKCPASVGEVAMLAARSALLEAHGNSGMIFSQIFKGFALGLKDCTYLTPVDLATALDSAAQSAYKSIQNPAHGTILSVIEAAAEAAHSSQLDDSIETTLEDIFASIVRKGREALYLQPDDLPQALRQAQVVDAGALGLYYFFVGMLRVMRGESLLLTDDTEILPLNQAELNSTLLLQGEHPLEERYCTEFLLSGCKQEISQLERCLVPIGTSLVISGDPELLKVHLHTNCPQKVKSLIETWGTVLQAKVEDMDNQRSLRLQQSRWEEEVSSPTPSLRLRPLLPPTPELIEAVHLPPCLVMCKGSGLEDYFQSQWGMELASYDRNGVLDNELMAHTLAALAKPTARTVTNTTGQSLLVFADSPTNAELCQDLSVSLNIKLKISLLQSPVQLLAALSSAAPWKLLPNVEKLSWGAVTVTPQNQSAQIIPEPNNECKHFSTFKDGICLGETNDLGEAVGMFARMESGQQVERLLLVVGRGCAPDAVEEVIKDLGTALPCAEFEFLYGGQADSHILMYAE